MIRLKKPRIYKEKGFWRVSIPMQNMVLDCWYLTWRDALAMGLANVSLGLG